MRASGGPIVTSRAVFTFQVGYRRGAYAATAAELLGVADLVSGYFDKRQEPDVPVDFAVDDDASIVEAHGGHRIAPFAGDPGDEELLRVAEALDA